MKRHFVIRQASYVILTRDKMTYETKETLSGIK